MNRRQFTASLAAVPVTNLLPLPLSAARTPQSEVVPAGTYAWAQLIARAQNRCSPEMLARHLRISPGGAQTLYARLLQDRVIHTHGAAALARAANPIDATGTGQSVGQRILTKLRDVSQQLDPDDADATLVKESTECLGYDEPRTKDAPDASSRKSLQEVP